MIPIQHSLTDTQHVSLVNLVQQPDSDDGFEAVLNAVAVEKMPKLDDLTNLIEDCEENPSTIDSDIHVRHVFEWFKDVERKKATHLFSG